MLLTELPPLSASTTPDFRGLLSFTFQLNVSAFYGIGGAFTGYAGGVYVVSEAVRGI